jgi:lysophospholipase L1-like esterase
MNYDNSTFVKSSGADFIRLANGQTISSNIPSDANYLYIQTTYDSETQTFEVASEKLIQKVNELQNDVQELENKISDIAKKRIAILGDSYSAYKGWNSGDDSYAYYDDEDTRNTGISSVTKMWWYQVLKAKNYIFEKCNAWGGTTICNTGYNGDDYSAISFISDRKENIGNPDLLIIFGGTNDAWAESPLGEYQYSGWTENALKKFRPAVAYLIDWMQLHHPNMEIVIVGNSTTSSDYTGSLQTIAEHYNLPFVLPASISTVNGHPNETGMNQIASAVLSALS